MDKTVDFVKRNEVKAHAVDANNGYIYIIEREDAFFGTNNVSKY